MPALGWFMLTFIVVKNTLLLWMLHHLWREEWEL